MQRIMIAGIGTNVGKTIVSAIVTTLMDGDYWKPVQSGPENDSDVFMMKNLINTSEHKIYDPSYNLKAPLSPHHAARLEKIIVDPTTIIPPRTARPLIIESVGGVLVPLTTKLLTIDLFKSWDCKWIIVSKHYLGSINHTLLTLEQLKRSNVKIAGLIFNGQSDSDSEDAILEITKLPLLGRLLPEKELNPKIIQRYAKQWKPCFKKLNMTP